MNQDKPQQKPRMARRSNTRVSRRPRRNAPGFILLEAMMAGAPIAASSLAPMPEFCRSAAEYFNALDVSDMSQKMEALLSDPARLFALSERSNTQASKFTWDEFVRRVVLQIEIAVKQKDN